MTREEAFARCTPDSYVEFYGGRWLVVPFAQVEQPLFFVCALRRSAVVVTLEPGDSGQLIPVGRVHCRRYAFVDCWSSAQLVVPVAKHLRHHPGAAVEEGCDPARMSLCAEHLAADLIEVGAAVVSAQLAEELPDVADEQVGGLHGGEVAAAAEFGPVHDSVFELDSAPDRHIQGEHRDPGRHRGTLTRAPGSGMRGLVVAVGRGPGGAGQPIEHHVGEQQIPVHRVLGQFGGRIGPLLELLHDPGQLPDRGVVQPVAPGSAAG